MAIHFSNVFADDHWGLFLQFQKSLYIMINTVELLLLVGFLIQLLKNQFGILLK